MSEKELAESMTQRMRFHQEQAERILAADPMVREYHYHEQAVRDLFQEIENLKQQELQGLYDARLAETIENDAREMIDE